MRAYAVRLLALAAAASASPPLLDREGEAVHTVWAQPTSMVGPDRGKPAILLLSPTGGTPEGNVTVMVAGVAFRDLGDVRCRFCTAEVRGFVLHRGAITCTAPPVSAFVPTLAPAELVLPTVCSVDVTLNGVDYTSNPDARFWYSRATVATMRPSGGPLAGGTRVALRGTGFADYGGGVQGAKCRFGDAVVPATISSHQTAHCVSPPTASPSDAPVWLSLNGYTDGWNVAGGMPFRYAHPAVLSQLHPLGGPSAGGAIVTVRGSGFVDDGGASASCDPTGGGSEAQRCAMHGVAAGMSRSNRPVGFACVFEGPPGTDSVKVPATHQDASTGGELLCRTPAGTAGLARPVGPWCASHGHAPHCDDPAYAAASDFSAVVVRVTLNGNASDASPTSLVYMLLDPQLPRLDLVEPWGGPADGGTAVSIVGDALLSMGPRPLCRFGYVEVPAVVGGLNGSRAMLTSPLPTRVVLHDTRAPRIAAVQTGRLITCVSPPGHAFGSRFVRLSVSLNGIDFSVQTLNFRYTDFGVSTVRPPGGPLAGGTAVVVRGRSFSTFGGLRCVFGERSVPATLVEPRALRCDAPAADASGAVVLSVSINGELDSRALEAGNLSFAYYDDANLFISSLSPALGPAFGGTPVTLHGTGLAVHGTPQCRFGDHPAVNATYAAGVDASFDPDTGVVGRPLAQMVCHSPRHALNRTSRQSGESVGVWVSLNGDPNQFVERAAYLYTHSCRDRRSVESYSPSDVRDVLARYLSANPPDTALVDSNSNGELEAAEIEAAISRYNDPTTAADAVLADAPPTVAALDAYELSSCFESDDAAEHGLQHARVDDRTFSDS